MPKAELRHQRIRELIPWYVTGTLDEREMDLVSAHLTGCVDCAGAVKKEVLLSRRVRQEPMGMQGLMAIQTPAFEALQDSLRREPGEIPPGERRVWQAPALAPALATALLVVFVAGASFFFGRASIDSTYQVMTSSDGHRGAVIQLIFHPSTSEQDIRQLLTDAEGVLLGNPSEKGVYRIGLPKRRDGREYAARLQAHPAVRWAEVELQ